MSAERREACARAIEQDFETSAYHIGGPGSRHRIDRIAAILEAHGAQFPAPGEPIGWLTTEHDLDETTGNPTLTWDFEPNEMAIKLGPGEDERFALYRFPALLDVANERPGMSHRFAPGQADSDVCRMCGEGPMHAWHTEARLLDVVDEQVEPGNTLDLTGIGYRLSAVSRTADEEAWSDQARQLVDDARTLYRAALRSHSSPPEPQGKGAVLEGGPEEVCCYARYGPGGREDCPRHAGGASSLRDVLDGLQEDAEEPGDPPAGLREGIEYAVRAVGEWLDKNEGCACVFAPEFHSAACPLFRAALASSPVPGHEK